MLSVNKKHSLVALDILLRQAIRKVQPLAILVYADAWKNITGKSFPSQ